MSRGYSSPVQLTEDLLKTYKQMEKTDQTVPTTKPRKDNDRSIKPQDKTGAYGEKRKPGDYLK